MRAILDTHAFIWWVTDNSQLSSTVSSIIADPSNVLFLSAASAWEIVIKVRLRKLNLPEPPETYIPSQLTINRFEGLPIQMVHALQVTNLPDLHCDPFDRIIIAHSQVEKMPIVTVDTPPLNPLPASGEGRQSYALAGWGSLGDHK
ncbi:type II toxin-antitoxin system VapC family toxin [Hassallia byssoidea VB512170]|uniref:Type II toxin-antitoxin system VapC family toxin n=1 Tax=Hassallia byssoidea VB512170 TaxID=1304833 RepID=A0A846HE56_9CYAN|nr:type II toxin-antitoxin system VapC family toxin [Hassalia byssoidea]NEU75069.1 type II toxin-antitoxin system VapC family toxin [Hassalia byssoidea VB512170]